MNHEPLTTGPSVGYANAEVTKAPNWHGLVAWDMLFNNLTTGLFLVTAAGELARPDLFAPLSAWAYALALVFLLCDLACLVLDLGDPLRFHHMLRVFKPTSPMSLGTWCLTVYSLPLTLIVAIDVLPGLRAAVGPARTLLVVAGILPALGSAAYKGVLFSTSSQPAWKDARWFGAYLTNSALMLGVAELMGIALVLGQPRAVGVLRLALGLMLILNLIPLRMLAAELRTALVRSQTRSELIRLATISVGVGTLLPLGLCLVATGRPPLLVAVGLILAGSLSIRYALVKLPHELRERVDTADFNPSAS
jgi:Ni/Fe-hydrogenase subunit HybB-like protein